MNPRLERAHRCLTALSVGDAFGERFFGEPGQMRARIRARMLPAGSWRVTDDTVLAQAVCDVLAARGCIDADHLVRAIIRRYRDEPGRGYGGGFHQWAGDVIAGLSWRRASLALFDGSGSKGNGGAMRAPPIGAYFHDDEAALIENVRRASEVTHAHAEGQAGAVAVAAAAAWAARGEREPGSLFELACRVTPAGVTRDGIEKAASLNATASIEDAVDVLGNGSRVLAEDTVPLCLWLVAHHGNDYEEALWRTVEALGDRDTTCAIVGGIIGSRPGVGPPETWLRAREPLPP